MYIFFSVIGHHAAALKAYLEAAIASSDFFSQPLPKAVMTDAVYRRMIKCCAALQCHTQVSQLMKKSKFYGRAYQKLLSQKYVQTFLANFSNLPVYILS